jgi:hypothetical protein
MEWMDRKDALAMLNGTLMQFVGDSTSGRAARQLSAFLLQHPFEQVRDHFGFHHVLHSAEESTTMTLRFRWMPTADELNDGVLDVVESMNSSIAHWAAVKTPPGTPELPESMLPQPVAARRVLILTLSSHDVAFRAWNWMVIGERVLDQAVRACFQFSLHWQVVACAHAFQAAPAHGGAVNYVSSHSYVLTMTCMYARFEHRTAARLEPACVLVCNVCLPFAFLFSTAVA